jgi:hypothetical protein
MSENFSASLKSVEQQWSFDVPTLHTSFEQLTEGQEQTLGRIGMVGEVGKKGSFFGSPPSIEIKTLMQLPIVDKRTFPGNVNIDGYIAYCMLMKAAQVYSVFSHDAVKEHSVHFVAEDAGITAKGDIGRITVSSFDGSRITEWAELLGEGESLIKQVRDFAWGGLSDVRMRGKKSKVDGRGLIQNMPGIFFPYFDGMVLPDKTLMDHVFSRYFLCSLGATQKDVESVYIRIRRGIRSMAFSRGGKVLSHLYAGINLAAQSGSAITVIVEGSIYQGFTLQRPVLSIFLFGKSYKERQFQDLVLDLRVIAEHDRILGKVIVLLNTPVKADGMPVYTFEMADIITSRKLARVLSILDLSLYDLEAENGLKDTVGKLQYGDKFPAVTLKTLRDFFAYIDTGDELVLS